MYWSKVSNNVIDTACFSVLYFYKRKAFDDEE